MTLEIAVAGDSKGPFPAQVEGICNTVADFSGLQQRVNRFLEAELKSLPKVVPENFRIRGLWFLWPKVPDYFIVDLRLEGDEFGLWKLEFEGKQATNLSRDD